MLALYLLCPFLGSKSNRLKCRSTHLNMFKSYLNLIGQGLVSRPPQHSTCSLRDTFWFYWNISILKVDRASHLSDFLCCHIIKTDKVTSASCWTVLLTINLFTLGPLFSKFNQSKGLFIITLIVGKSLQFLFFPRNATPLFYWSLTASSGMKHSNFIHQIYWI